MRRPIEIAVKVTEPKATLEISSSVAAGGLQGWDTDYAKPHGIAYETERIDGEQKIFGHTHTHITLAAILSDADES